ncbi:unnamed protein product [Strongylus vulgaris]|uniref:Amino acid transporter transmembrane domain-containing protein n=1 Tax=Strongylus vulgaris TaxID=40348 RepID=A0A3P7KU32_STRVU|nr:unnamed protein product [Strongylus vulgaris]
MIYQDAPRRQFSMQNLFTAYGTIVFAFGCHAFLPALQHDMKKPRLFARSLWVAHIVILLYYLSIAIGGYLVYGASVGDVVIHSIQWQWLQQTANVIIMLHVLSTMVMAFSPMVQQIETVLRVSHGKFCFAH